MAGRRLRLILSNNPLRKKSNNRETVNRLWRGKSLDEGDRTACRKRSEPRQDPADPSSPARGSGRWTRNRSRRDNSQDRTRTISDRGRILRRRAARLIKARVRIRSRSTAMSKSIVKSLEPDNAEMKGLNILTRAAANYVSFSIVFDGRIETFIFTLDDLLRCVQAADATLGMISKNKAS